MKYNKFTLALFAVSLLFVSCNSGKKKDALKSEYVRPASIEYSGQDSAAIKSLIDNYVENFKNKNFNVTADMLYYLKNDSVFPLSDETKEKYKQAYSHMPIYGCKVKSLVLRSDKNNEVKLSVQIVSSGDLDDDKGVTSVSLNPVLVDGKWYLTLLDEYAPGVENVYDKK